MAAALDIERARERLRHDTPFWGRHCCTILSREKIPIRLVAKPWQLKFDAAMEAQRAAGRPIRIRILKARKLGFSTWTQAKFMQRITQRPFEYANVVAQDRKTAGVLQDMAVLMYRRLPSEEELGMGFSIRPDMVGHGSTRSGSRWMALGDHQREEEASIYETLTAGSAVGGRGMTPSLMHLSEVAWYEDPGFIVGAANAVPDTPNTIIVDESTANGFNHFHEAWERAVAGAEDPETGGLYLPLFFGWQDNPENAMAFPNDAARDRFAATVGDAAGGGDPEEVELVERFGLSFEQLRWRRNTISDKCNGKIDLFHQEHPMTPEQAFIGSGSPFFSSILVSRMIGEAEKAMEPVRGLLTPGAVETRRSRSGTIDVPQRALWVPSSAAGDVEHEIWGRTGELLVWEHPVNDATQGGLPEDEKRPDGQYIVFGDVAQGASSTTEPRDFSVIQVLDHISRMQVARYRSRIDIHDFPLVLLLVAVYYNNAYLAPEATGLGIGVVDALSKDYRYPYMYRRRRSGDHRRDGVSETPLLGWYTSPKSKPLMEMHFGEVLKTGTHGCRDLPTAREFTTYIELNERGQHGAMNGSYDDLAMAFMGAHRVAADLTPRVAGQTGGRIAGVENIPGY